MKVLIKEPNKKSRVEEIENELQPIQEIVGGYIETVTLSEKLVMILNEEGKLQGLEPNFQLGKDVIVGTVIFAGIGGEDFTSITDQDLEELQNQL